jgi:hypothetical protein
MTSTAAALWTTLLMGVVIGSIFGGALAWRLARKLEFFHIRLRDWDMQDWQQEPTRYLPTARSLEGRS